MSNCIRSFDFLEGVRAVLVDKDKMPKWAASSVADMRTMDIKSLCTLSTRPLKL